MLQHLLRDQEIQECRKRTDEDIELGLGEDQLVKSTVGGKSSLKVGNEKWVYSVGYMYCRISYGGGLGTRPCIMGLTTQDPYIQKEHTELYKILKFCVNWANIEQDTAIQKLQNLQRNVWISGQVSGNPYICY